MKPLFLTLLVILSFSGVAFSGCSDGYDLECIYDTFFGDDSESDESEESIEDNNEKLVLTVKNLTSVIYSTEAKLEQIPNIVWSLKNLTQTVLVVQKQLSKKLKPLNDEEIEREKEEEEELEEEEHDINQIPKLENQVSSLTDLVKKLSKNVENLSEKSNPGQSSDKNNKDSDSKKVIKEESGESSKEAKDDSKEPNGERELEKLHHIKRQIVNSSIDLKSRILNMDDWSSDSDGSSISMLASSTEDVASNMDGDVDIAAFDTDLPAEHNYLGALERVSGVEYLEPNRTYTLPIIFHNSLVFPGETLPMILAPNMFVPADNNEDGILFGLVFRELRGNHNFNLYGVTCLIYEKSTDDSESLTIKSRAYQRFFIRNNEQTPEFVIRNRTRYAAVTILPEVELCHPIYGHDSNSLSKFRKSELIKSKLLQYQSKSLTWPDFVYRMYDVSIACEKIKKFLATLKIDTVPMDLIAMSFWFSQNAILSTECRRKAFLTNNVLERILLICQTLQEEKFIICKQCRTKIAKFNSLFPMSKEGVRTNFCNAYGFIHDTHTVMSTLPEAVTVSGDLTSEFCWFPGYMYRYVYCGYCTKHLGWKYFSKNLMPRSFLGLSGNCIYFDNVSNLQTDTGSLENDSSTDELIEWA
ncbi:protein cereblon homolog [Contarinia nasturtii]|uniref:protein cereblon homolog n=1 Tax=Contarinia nasturtii TaxID=265458 RepID=UPI0012D46D76|nr:protein cereblon homolog [Contarinia nasturtii]